MKIMIETTPEEFSALTKDEIVAAMFSELQKNQKRIAKELEKKTSENFWCQTFEGIPYSKIEFAITTLTCGIKRVSFNPINVAKYLAIDASKEEEFLEMLERNYKGFGLLKCKNNPGHFLSRN